MIFPFFLFLVEHFQSDSGKPFAYYSHGAIVPCPAATCGARLYRVRAEASFVDVVIQDETLLEPIKAAIPARTGWEALACPLCGTALTREGRRHTVPRGWW